MAGQGSAGSGSAERSVSTGSGAVRPHEHRTDDRLCRHGPGSYSLGQELALMVPRVGLHDRGRDLFPGSCREVERARGEGLCSAPDRQPEAATRNRSPRLEHAGVGGGFEGGTRHVAQTGEELLPPRFVRFQDSAARVSREIRRREAPLRVRPTANRARGLGDVPRQQRQSAGEPGGVQSGDVGRPDTASRATETARKVPPGPALPLPDRRVESLDELFIGRDDMRRYCPPDPLADVAALAQPGGTQAFPFRLRRPSSSAMRSRIRFSQPSSVGS